MTSSAPTRTAQVFDAIKVFAIAHETVTYGYVVKRVGISPRVVQQRLHAIWQWCESQGYPHLNAIVVNAKTMRPGQGYKPFHHEITEPEFQSMKEKVFAFHWENIKFPE